MENGSEIFPFASRESLGFSCTRETGRQKEALAQLTGQTLSLPTSDVYIHGAPMVSFECQDKVPSLTRFDSLKITQGKIHLDDG